MGTVNVTLEDASDGGNVSGMKMIATPNSVRAGQITIYATNELLGLIHEVIVVRPAASGAALPYDANDGRVIEKQINDLGEVSDLPPGKSGSLTVRLTSDSANAHRSWTSVSKRRHTSRVGYRPFASGHRQTSPMHRGRRPNATRTSAQPRPQILRYESSAWSKGAGVSPLPCDAVRIDATNRRRHGEIDLFRHVVLDRSGVFATMARGCSEPPSNERQSSAWRGSSQSELIPCVTQNIGSLAASDAASKWPGHRIDARTLCRRV